MFIGHYSPTFLLKRAEPAIPLWALFLAVQLLDLLWGLFVLLDIEKLRIVPGFTKTNALDLYYMPYTHSLPGALGWALAATAGYGALKRSRRSGLLVGAAVFSHWPLDLVVHLPDLALYDNRLKVGLGLWNYPELTLLLESALVFAGVVSYLANTRALKPSGGYAIPLFMAVWLALQAAMAFAPPPPSDKAMAVTALTSYLVLAVAIGRLEKGRAVID